MRKYIILLFVMFSATLLWAENASNIRVRQEGKTIVVTYDLSKESNVRILVASGESNKFIELKSAFGKVGTNIPAGKNHIIIWDPLREKETFVAHNVRFKVEAQSSYNSQNEKITIPILEQTKPIVVKKSLVNYTHSRKDSHSSTDILVQFTIDKKSISLVLDQVFVQYSTSKDFKEYTEEKMYLNNSENKWKVQLRGLQPSTTYYLRYFIQSQYSSALLSRVDYFVTLETTTATVVTNEVLQIETFSAVVSGAITSDGGETITESGVVYSTEPYRDPTIIDNKIKSDDAARKFTCNLTYLQPNTTYSARAYAINKKGIAYGSLVNFTTKKQIFLPSIITGSITQVTDKSALINCNVIFDGGAAIIERGVCYSTSHSPTVSSPKKSCSSTGTFTVCLTNLQPKTTYYVRAYAQNIQGTSYGEEQTFTTNAIGQPIVKTSAVTEVGHVVATAGGYVTSEGNATVTQRGICYSQSNNPTIQDHVVTSSIGSANFIVKLTKLSVGTTYYIRAFATNKNGTSYGEEEKFTTYDYSKPTLTTTEAKDITYTSAVVGGNITSDGGKSVIERGVVYSTSGLPTTSDRKVVNGSSKGWFTCDITDLQENTTYYIRAYAINDKGTAYGDQISFRTKSSRGVKNGHEWVDLGLSVKWATCNIGANTPSDYGGYYRYGETTPRSQYSAKYNGPMSENVASSLWGIGWRLPTAEEVHELARKCTCTYTSQNGIRGCKITGPNGSSIFIPLAGYIHESGSAVKYRGEQGFYWTATRNYKSAYNSWHVLKIYPSPTGIGECYQWGNVQYGSFALPIRPVCP